MNKRTFPLAAGVLALGALSLFAVGCATGAPKGVTVVKDFDVKRYSGKWYEIARLDHSFERGLERVTAEYTPRPDGTVAVVNRGFRTRDGQWKSVEGTAKFVGDPGTGALKVSFFGPFYGGYNVIALDEAYQHAMVTGPNRGYLWILSRKPELGPDVKSALVRQATDLGYDTGKLIYVNQSAQ